MKSQLLAIYLKHDALHKLCYLNFSKDGSVYLSFPRKGNRQIVQAINVPDLSLGDTAITLDTKDGSEVLPSITYHPGTKSIHTNLQINKRPYKLDAPIIQFLEGDAARWGAVCFPLAQIVISDIQDLDIVTSGKYKETIELETYKLKEDSGMNVEIWLHSKWIKILPENLPMHQARIKGPGRMQHARFVPDTSHPLALLISVGSVSVSHDVGKKRGTIVSVFNKNQPYIFQLGETG